MNWSQDMISFVWKASAASVDDIVKARPELASRLKALDDKAGDRFIEIVDAATGVPSAYLVLETGKASFGIESVRAAGEYILVNDTENRQLVYSAKTGALIRRFIGAEAGINPKKGMIVTENMPGHLFLYDIATGKELGKLSSEKISPPSAFQATEPDFLS